MRTAADIPGGVVRLSVLVVAVGVSAVLPASSSPAQGAPSSQSIGQPRYGVVSDGARFVAWAATDGRLRLRDTQKRRTLVGPTPEGGCVLLAVAVRTGLLGCGSIDARRAVLYDFATATYSPVPAPRHQVASYIALGRRWVLATDDSIKQTYVYIDRQTGRAVYRTSDEDGPAADLDVSPLRDPPRYPTLAARPDGARSVLMLLRSRSAKPIRLGSCLNYCPDASLSSRGVVWTSGATVHARRADGARLSLSSPGGTYRPPSVTQTRHAIIVTQPANADPAAPDEVRELLWRDAD